MFEPISVSLLPNTFSADVYKAVGWLFSPFKWVKGKQTEKLEQDFEQFFPGFQAVSFLSGRTALLAALKALGIGEGDQVLLQSFTCVVVPNAVLKLKAKPVYVDIDLDSFNMDPSDLEEKINSKSRAIVVQHTFGFPAKMERIMELAKKHNLAVVEDCAHGFGIKYQKNKLGAFGDVSFFSFGRDKAVTAVFGGMAIARDLNLAKKLKDYQAGLPEASIFFVFRQLVYLPVFTLILKIYAFLSLGKIILLMLQKLKIFLKPVFEEEKNGAFPEPLLAKMPNSLAGLARFQFQRLAYFNKKRKQAVSFYAQNLKNLPVSLPSHKVEGKIAPLLRFSLKADNPQSLYCFARQSGIILNNWYYPAISPAGVNYRKIGYRPESCPLAEKAAAGVINLPTHPKMDKRKLKKVVKVVKDYFKKRSLNG